MRLFTKTFFPRVALPLAFSIAAYAQAGKSPSFDVATVKPAVLPQRVPGPPFVMTGPTGGPGSSDPGRVRYPSMTLKNLLTIAYRVKNYQVAGPAWLETERYEVTATLPPDTTPEQFQLMLQNLLAERFQMKVHRETRELPMYSLTVAKGGLKMKESAPPVQTADSTAPGPPPMPSGPLKIGSDGFPIFPAPRAGRPNNSMSMMPGRAKMTGTMQTMNDLASRLTQQLNRPVMDETGLSGKYDFVLTFALEGMTGGVVMGPPPGGAGGGGSAPLPVLPEGDPLPTLQAAVQSELGLKLDPKKGNVEMIVVDAAEKVPTEN